MVAVSLALFVTVGGLPLASFHMEDAGDGTTGESVQTLAQPLDGDPSTPPPADDTTPSGEEPLPGEEEDSSEPVEEEPAEEPTDEPDSGPAAQVNPVVTAIPPLAAEVAAQVYPVGTPLEELALPATLRVQVAGPEGEALEQDLPVKWQSSPIYSADSPSDFAFSPIFIDEVTLAEGLRLPTIAITLKEAEITTFSLARASPIYVSSSGNDTTGTGSDTEPFQTLEYVFARINDGTIPSPATVSLMSDIAVSAGGGSEALLTVPAGKSVTLTSEGGATLSREGGQYVFLEVSGTLTLENLTITGANNSGSSGKSRCSIVNVWTGGNLIIAGATLRDNQTGGPGGAVWVAGGTATLSSGSIISNTAGDYGGGVLVDMFGSFTMAGGSISGNTAPTGGGVEVNEDGFFYMTGGSISGNTATGGSASGRDVYVGDYGTFIPTAGTIGTAGVGGYAIHSNGTTLITSGVTGALKVFVEYAYNGGGSQQALGQLESLFAGRYAAASRFVSYASELSIGVTRGNTTTVELCSDLPVKLHYPANEAIPPTYHATLEAALGAVAAENGAPAISLRTNMTATATANLLAANTTVCSENFFGGTTAHTLTAPSGLTLFNVGSGKQLTLETLNITGADASYPVLTASGGTATAAATAIVANTGGAAATVSGGTLALAGGTLTSGNGTGVGVSGGTFNMTGGSVTTTHPTGGCVTVSAGSFNMSGGGIQGAGGNGVTIQGSGNVRLTGTALVSGNLDGVGIASGTLTLDGATISGNTANGIASSGGTLTLTSGAITGNGSHGLSLNGTTTSRTMAAGVTISGNTGHGVYVEGGGFTMNGGAIDGNTGNGVNLTGGSFAMAGGALQNHAGAGVALSAGTFTLSGAGAITANGDASTGAAGAGVSLSGSGTLNIQGGSIHANKNQGVYMSGGTATMSGGAVYNHAGAGVYAGLADGPSFTMSGGSIYQNRNSGIRMGGGQLELTDDDATLYENSAASGGGIHLSGATTFAMSGGTIEDNTATGNGGGILVDAGTSLDMSGGTISGNSAANGGGLANTGSFTMSGGSFDGNTATGTGRAIYLNGAGMTLKGGTVSASQASNGIGRSGSETLLFGSSFATEGVFIVLERAGGFYANGDPVHGGSTPGFEDWLNDTNVNGRWTALAGCFWAMDEDDSPLRGVYRGGRLIEFAPASIRLVIGEGGAAVTSYHQTLDEALQRVGLAPAGNPTKAVVYLGGDLETTPTSLRGSRVDVTLTSEDAGPYTLLRDGTGDLITLATDQTLRLGDLTLDGGGAAAGGSLVQVNGGTLVLGGDAALTSNDYTGQPGAAISASGGHVLMQNASITTDNLGSSNVHLADGAVFELVQGAVGGLSWDGDAATKVKINSSFNPSGTSVRMVGDYVRGAKLTFLDCPAALMDAAAPCFSAQTQGGESLLGGTIIENSVKSVIWLGYVVTLAQNGGGAVPYTSLKAAVDAIVPNGGAGGTATLAEIVLLESVTAPALTIPAGVSATLAPKDAADFGVTRAGSGDLFTVAAGAALTLTGGWLDGDETGHPAAGGSLVKTAGALTINSTTLQSNANVGGTGGGVHVAAGGSLVMTGGTITGCAAATGGGLYMDGTTLTLTDVTLEDNTAQTGGGAHVESGAPTLTRVSLLANTATASGGGLSVAGGSAVLTSPIAEGNKIGSSLTAAGSAIALSGGKITLLGTPVIGSWLYENNLARTGGTLALGETLGAGSLIHVGGIAAEGGEIAAKDTAVTTAEAQAFRHTGADLLIGAADGTRVLWALPTDYPLYDWNAEGTSFTCDAPSEEPPLYLIINDLLITGFTAADNGSGGTTITLLEGWYPGGTPPTSLQVLASFPSGYGAGASRPIGVKIGLADEVYFTTLERAFSAVTAGSATITLYADTRIDGSSGNGLITPATGTSITLTSGDTAARTIRRATGGHLFTLPAGTTLTLDNLVLDGGSATTTGSLARVNGGALTLDGTTLQNNYTSGNGGALLVETGALRLADSSLTGNRAALGGAIYQSGGVAVADGATLAANDATGDGGALYQAGGSFTAEDTTLSGNTAATSGGAIHTAAGADLGLEGGALTGNTATVGAGGGLYFAGRNLGGTDVQIDQNTAGTNGGGLWLAGTGTLSLAGGEITGNEAASGAGLYLESGALALSTDLADNIATASGGAVYSKGSLTVSGGGWTENEAQNGAGAYLEAGTLTLNGGDISTNTAGVNGGGLYLAGGTLNLAGGGIDDNTAAGDGGGVYAVGGSLTMAGGALSGNGAAGVGDGIFLSTQSRLRLVSGTLPAGNGVAIHNVDSPGTMPATPPILVMDGCAPPAASFALEGVVSSGDVVAIPLLTLVATFDGDFGGSLTGDALKAAKKAAAGTLSHSPQGIDAMRGLLSGDEQGVILGDASSVELVVNGVGPTPYATIEEAMADIPAGATATVTVLKPVQIGELITLTGGRTVTLTAATALVATRAPGVPGHLFTVDDTASLTIGGSLTLSGNKLNFTGPGGTGGSLVLVDGGALTLGGNAILSNNRTTGNGGAVQVAAGSFTMAGGALRANEAANGGGVYAGGDFTMSGGEMSGNTASANGGGLYYSQAGGALTLSGGKIGLSGFANEAVDGAGVYVDAADSIALNGAEITYNEASGTGGGLYVRAGALAMSGGLVGRNEADSAEGLYLHTGATMTFTGGALGASAADPNGLVQRLARDSAPSLTVGALATGARLNFEGRAVGSNPIAPCPDDALVALFAANTYTYAEKLAATASFADSGHTPPYYVNLDIKAEGLVLRQYITRTEPLYTEADAPAVGSAAGWVLDDDVTSVTGVTLTGALTPGDDYTLALPRLDLTKDLLDTLENGTYLITLATNLGDITTGFTVAGAPKVTLTGTVSGEYRFLAGALAAASGNSASTITLLDSLPIPQLTVTGGKAITLTSNGGTKTLTRNATGGLITVETGASLTLRDVVLDGNATGFASAGGPLVNVGGGALILENGALLQNNAGASGGALAMSGGSILVDGGTVQSNTATDGGAAHLTGGTLTLRAGQMTGNGATQNGGAVYLGGGALVQEGGAITGNTAAASGGGAYLTGGRLTASGGTLDGNAATAGDGGGVYLGGTSSLYASGTAGAGFLLTENTAPAGRGGGVFMESGATLALHGGRIGKAPASGATALDNGVYFHKSAPPTLGVGYSSATGNLNLEGACDAADVPLWGGFAIAKTPDHSWDTYDALADIANSIHYLESGQVYNGAAVPGPGGAPWLTAIEDLYDCYTFYQQGVSGPDLYWRFGRANAPGDLAQGGVRVDGQSLAPTQYRAGVGSIRLALEPAYLDTLTPGVHKLAVYLTADPSQPAFQLDFYVRAAQTPPPGDGDGDGPGGDGSGDGQGGNGNGNGGGNTGGSGTGGGQTFPRTGDATPLECWLMLLVLCGTGLAALLAALGRRRAKRQQAGRQQAGS